MSEHVSFLSDLFDLIEQGHWEVSKHAFEELANDGLLIEPLVIDIKKSKIVEYYPNYHKGPCLLVLQFDEYTKPVHLLWGIAAGTTEPAILVTAYRPSSQLWTTDFLSRKTK